MLIFKVNINFIFLTSDFELKLDFRKELGIGNTDSTYISRQLNLF